MASFAIFGHLAHPISKVSLIRRGHFGLSVGQKFDRLGREEHYFCGLFQGQLFQSCSTDPIRILGHRQWREAQGLDCSRKVEKDLPVNKCARIQYLNSDAWSLRPDGVADP